VVNKKSGGKLMTGYGKGKRGLVEELRELRTHLGRLEQRNAELMQIQEMLQESVNQFKTIFDNTLVGLYRTTPDGQVLMANSALLKMLGYSSFDQLARRNLEQGWYEPQYLRSAIKKCGESEGKIVGLESTWKKSDGATLFVRESVRAVRDESGNILYYQGTVEDITEYKQNKMALQISEQMFEILVGNVSEGVDIVDENLRCVFANRAGEEIFGVGAGGLLGRTLYEFVSDEGHGLIEEQLSRRREGIASSYDLEIIRPDGRKRQLIVTGTPRFSEDGKYLGALAIFFDVTKRKRAEESLRKAHNELEMRIQERTAELQRANETLRESEEKFRSLAEQSPNMIFINRKGRIVYINKKCDEVMGYTKEELCSDDFDFSTLIAPESLDLVMDNFNRHLRGENVQPYDYTLITKSGERIEAINASKLIQYEGQTAILGVVTDITERKRAERAIRESEERLKILFESAPDAIYLIDSEGRFVDGNKAALELTGFARDEVMGKSLAEADLLSAEQLSMAEANLKKVVTGKLFGPIEYILKRKDGSYVSVEVRTFPVKIAGRMLTLGIARDVTEHKHAEKKLLEYQAELKSLASQLSLTEERERRRLATDLHDRISQSLVISKIKLDQLCKSSISNGLSKSLEDISKCLEQIIDDTRALTFDLSYPILYELGFEAAVAEWLTDQVQEKHGVETEFVDDGHVKPLDDDIRVLLFRNVRELLINVVKHARARKVRVTIHKVNKHIKVSVEDDGVGFDPVEVSSMAAKRAEFGLFSIKERLEQLGGRIEIDSGPGHGISITMTAPLKHGNSPDEA